MNILEAFDLTGSYRAASQLCHCSPNTVKKYVQLRDAGTPMPPRPPRTPHTREHADLIDSMVERSQGLARADLIYNNLVAMGYTKSYRTCCRHVREAKLRYNANHARVHRPWVAHPGEWMQFDYGDGPVVAGVKTILFVAWLPWSKARFVMPLVDKKLPSVVEALDAAFRYFGGVPRYVLTDNERTITIDQVCNLPVRNGKIVEFGHWYGTTIHTCTPYDPASKGGVENSVKIAKADLVPSRVNLREDYASFADLVQACRDWCQEKNTTVNAYGFIPNTRLETERTHLKALPKQAYTVLAGQPRSVGTKTPMITFENASYSVPHTLMGHKVYVRCDRVQKKVVITHKATDGSTNHVATHPQCERGQTSIKDEHFPKGHPTGPLNRVVKPHSDIEAKFLDIGQGAHDFVTVAAAEGTTHLKKRISLILDLMPAWTPQQLDTALQRAATTKRLRLSDIESILHNCPDQIPQPTTIPHIESSLAQGTSGWAQITERKTS